MASAARLDATNCWHRVAVSANAGTNSAHTPLPRDGAGGMRKILFALGKRPPASYSSMTMTMFVAPTLMHEPNHIVPSFSRNSSLP